MCALDVWCELIYCLPDFRKEGIEFLFGFLLRCKYGVIAYPGNTPLGIFGKFFRDKFLQPVKIITAIVVVVGKDIVPTRGNVIWFTTAKLISSWNFEVESLSVCNFEQRFAWIYCFHIFLQPGVKTDMQRKIIKAVRDHSMLSAIVYVIDSLLGNEYRKNFGIWSLLEFSRVDGFARLVAQGLAWGMRSICKMHPKCESYCANSIFVSATCQA